MANCDTCGNTGRVSPPLTDKDRARGVLHKVVACPDCTPSGRRICEGEIRREQERLSGDAEIERLEGINNRLILALRAIDTALKQDVTGNAMRNWIAEAIDSVLDLLDGRGIRAVEKPEEMPNGS